MTVPHTLKPPRGEGTGAHDVPGAGKRGSPRSLLAFAAIALAGAATFVGPHSCSASATSSFATPFSADSPWRQLISPDPVVDPNSDAMIASVESTRALHANLVEFGIPIYRVTPDTPSHSVTCSGTAGVFVRSRVGWC